MAKITWDGDITVADIENAEDGYQEYAGPLPPPGVYRFKITWAKFQTFQSGNQGISLRLELDGSWKKEHAKYDGCPLWDRIVMTKAAASFLKAFAAGIGVSANDLVNKVIRDEEDRIVKIGRKTLEGLQVYVNVKRGEWEDVQRLEKSGTGYQIFSTEIGGDDDEAESDEQPRAKAKSKGEKVKDKGKKGKKNKASEDDDEPPF